MNVKPVMYLTAILILSLLLFGCMGTNPNPWQSPTPTPIYNPVPTPTSRPGPTQAPTPTLNYDIYVVGARYNPSGSPCYWKNGELFTLASTEPAVANSMAIVGSDIYFTGWYMFSEIAATSCYWKNGVRYDLVPPYDNPYHNTMGTSAGNMSVQDMNIYIPGSFIKDNYYNSPCYWKNFERVDLTGTQNVNTYATDVFISVSDVYVSGYSEAYIACYWKNGERIDLDSSHSVANKIRVNGNDVYVLGYEGKGLGWTACFWLNGVKYYPDSVSSQSFAEDILFDNSDVWITGSYGGQLSMKACYWKNGVKYDLESTGDSSAEQIIKCDQELIITGYDGNRFGYWRNGKRTDLDLEGYDPDHCMTLWVSLVKKTAE